MKSIVESVPEKPYTISTDEGGEINNNVMKAYLDSVGIKPRVKSKGDSNALGVVDKAIQTMKRSFLW